MLRDGGAAGRDGDGLRAHALGPATPARSGQFAAAAVVAAGGSVRRGGGLVGFGLVGLRWMNRFYSFIRVETVLTLICFIFSIYSIEVIHPCLVP